MRARGGGGWSGTPPSPQAPRKKLLPRQARDFFCLSRFAPNLFFGFPDIRDREEGRSPYLPEGEPTFPPGTSAKRRFVWPLAKRHMRAAAGGHVRRVSEHSRHGCYLGPHARSNQPQFSSPTCLIGHTFFARVFRFSLKIRFCTYLAQHL